ncbi:rRNA pseudouridine synthase [candidate division WOR-3 bacterium]|nr:rRNA pseudouridine synthase [candidate division WOR-3 bacterium]
MRLNKFIAKCGITSRRKADELIENGKVKLNGKIVKELGVEIDTEKNTVEIEGKLLKIEPSILIVANKPIGYVTSLSDKHASYIVTDLIKDVKYRFFPVGRLDKDAEGLLLLTNDGNIAYRLTHPKFEIEKEYTVWINKEFNKSQIKTLESGIYCENERLKAKSIELLEDKKLRIVLTEGKKREIKKMLEATGYRVEKLQRVRIGNLRLGTLKSGEYKIYKGKDVEEKLAQITKL